MRRAALSAVLVAALGWSATALAWRTIEPPRIWDLTDMPVVWYAPDVDEYEPVAMPTGVTIDHLETSIAHWWQDIPCSPLDAVYGGSVGNAGEYSHDNSTRFYYDDPRNQLGSGILAATMTWYDSGDVISSNGSQFYKTSDFDIIFNSDVNWGTTDEVYGGGCTGLYSFEAVATHEIGHGFGLGHPCEADEACPDPILRGAVMYWSIGSCETGREVPNEDDIAGINALYGIYTDFEAAGDTLGGIPLEVSFAVPDELTDGVETYLWTFGDGSDPSADAAPTHTYESEGQFTVSLAVTGTDPECGTFEDTARKVGYVLACDTPEPTFEWANLGEGWIQFNNTTPASTFGCIQDYTWDMGDGTELSGYEPQHDYGKDGSWTVTLTASGPGGSDVSKATIEVKMKADPREDEPHVCSASPRAGAPTGAAAAALLFVLLRLRRRS
ncbi:MAG: PKD domain-containing protein [Myxococcota bacterium]|nr:PKD domain-containing protein [Myxococcota bacterium]